MADELGLANSLVLLDPRVRQFGRPHSSLAHVVLSTTANTLLLTAPTSATLILYALWVWNATGTSANLQMGTGATLTQTVPTLGPLLTGFSEIIALPPTEFESDIYITSSVGGAALMVKAYAVAIG